MPLVLIGLYMVLDLKNASFYFKAPYEIIAFYVLSYNHKLWVKCFRPTSGGLRRRVEEANVSA